MNHNSHYLQLLKIPVWQVRGQESDEEMITVPTVAPELTSSPHIMATDHPSTVSPAQILTEPQVIANVDVPVPVAVPAVTQPVFTGSLKNCTACKLQHTRTQVIEGTGAKKASLFVITEAPTFNEDVAGQPFAEEAGKLFSNILKAIGYDMQDVYITPYVKCAPYQEFITQAEEQQCHQHLLGELNEVQPDRILLLGRNVAKYILNDSKSFDALRNQQGVLNVQGKNIPVYVSFNPYQVLKFPEEKRKVWADIKRLLA